MNSLIRNLFFPSSLLSVNFTKENLQEIKNKIRVCEKNNGIQLVFAYQTRRRLKEIFQNISPRTLALRQFRRSNVWDTEENNGILFYFLLADKNFEIIPDKGIAKSISTERWQIISDEIEKLLKKLPLHEAVLQGIDLIAKEVTGVVYKVNNTKNELSDEPVKV